MKATSLEVLTNKKQDPGFYRGPAFVARQSEKNSNWQRAFSFRFCG
jgi:hypothetical protein